MQAGRFVLLDNKPVSGFLLDFRRRFGGFFESAFAFVFFEGHKPILTTEAQRCRGIVDFSIVDCRLKDNSKFRVHSLGSSLGMQWRSVWPRAEGWHLAEG